MKIDWKEVEFWGVITIAVSVFIYCNVRMIIEQVWTW